MRAFFAIDLPDVIKRNISDLIRQLQNKYHHAPIRWVRTDHLHITLQFIEEIKIEHIPNLIEKVRHELKDKRSIHIKINNIDLIPNSYKPRVISLKVTPEDAIADLSKCLGRAISQMGYPIEKRAFRAHLTLGRIRESRKALLLENYSPPPIPSFRANSIVLYQSEPTHEGSNYYPLERITLNP